MLLTYAALSSSCASFDSVVASVRGGPEFASRSRKGTYVVASEEHLVLSAVKVIAHTPNLPYEAKVTIQGHIKL